MLVVSDSSPLIALVRIEQIDILPKLFKQMVIPPAVARELQSPRRDRSVRDLIASPPHWLTIKQPANTEPISDLHPVETEAIRLAIEIHANAIGTIRVLERGAEEGLLNLQRVFDRLKQTDFWISHDLLDERLKLHQARSKA